MKLNALKSLVVLSLITSSFAQAGIKEIIGAVTGGLVGGVLCNELGIGNGSGRTAAIALCAVGGSMIGGEIGRDMDEADARAFGESQRVSFDGDLNRDYEWDGSRYGSRTGVRGRMRPIRHGYHRHTREVCREYQSVTYRGNRSSETRSVVCKRNDGSFYSLEEKTLFINGQVVQTTRNENAGYDRNPPYVTPDRRPPTPRPVTPEYPRGRDRDGGRYDRGDRYCSGWNMNQVRHNDRVYTRYGQMGYFRGINRSGNEVSVSVHNYTQIVRVADLGIEGCSYGLRTGQRVSTRYGQQGTVGGVFANGDVAVVLGYGFQVLRRDDIYN